MDNPSTSQVEVRTLDTPATAKGPSRWLYFWTVLVGLALLGTYASIFIPAFVGRRVKVNRRSELTCGLRFYSP